MYSIFGYDKDGDIYECLVHVNMSLDTAISVANHIASMSPKRRSGESFDWLEVIKSLDDNRCHVIQCT